MSENNFEVDDNELNDPIVPAEENNHLDERQNGDEEGANNHDVADQAQGAGIRINFVEYLSEDSDTDSDEVTGQSYEDFLANNTGAIELPEELVDAIRRQPHEDIHRFLSGEFGRFRNWIVRSVRLSRVSTNSDEDSSSCSKDMPQNITFDKTLPTSHSYLGDMEECSGVAYRDQDTYQTLQIVYVRDFVLVPGQTVPMQFSRLTEISMLRRVMAQSDKTFGVLMMNSTDENSQARKLYSFGCTAEIRSYKDGEEHSVNTLRIVILGRQKFQVIEKRSQLNGNVIAKVKILEDVELPELHNSVGMCVKCSMRNSNSRNQSVAVNSNSFAETYRRKWAVTRHASSTTAWPPWVYRMYDTDYLRMQIFKEMREWNQKLEERECPLEATAFSYWVIMNFPISDTWRLRLLQLSSAVQRLRRELDLLQKCTILTCADCAQQIANRRDVFSMSVAGPMAAYLNPGGVIHETLTLYKASGVFHIGKKTTDHSWFPGYAWTICDCERCGRHMGWKYTATKPDLTPATFWGLTRSALTPRVPEIEDESNSTGENVETTAYEPQVAAMP